MEQEKELLERLINQAFESGYSLFSEEIVKQSQVLDYYIVDHIKGAESIG